MSSLLRRMKRMQKRAKFRERLDDRKYMGYLRRREKFGSKIGFDNPTAKDRKARELREQVRLAGAILDEIIEEEKNNVS